MTASDYTDLLRLLTGENPHIEVGFRRSETRPCGACSETTETYVVSIDGDIFERLCWTCFLATNAGERTPRRSAPHTPESTIPQGEPVSRAVDSGQTPESVAPTTCDATLDRKSSSQAGQVEAARRPTPALDGHARDESGAILCRICRRARATERIVFEGRNSLGNHEQIAHAVCDRDIDSYTTAIRDLGWSILGLSDVDEGPLGSSLRRAA